MENNSSEYFIFISVSAQVLGRIYYDLRRDGALKEVLYYQYNDVNYRWVSYTFENF
jgi:hypothetical protein